MRGCTDGFRISVPPITSVAAPKSVIRGRIGVERRSRRRETADPAKVEKRESR
jgi:hypothetical protein